MTGDEINWDNGRYYVVVRHGQDYSRGDWCGTGRGHDDLTAALESGRAYRHQHPEWQGWNRDIGVRDSHTQTVYHLDGEVWERVTD
jgi:hypothetical protein